MEEIEFTIPLNPVTKKNSQQIFRNKNTGKPLVAQSDRYKQYERDCAYFIKQYGISHKVNVKAVYYRKTKHRVDLCNLHAALHDILVKHGALVDDDCKIIHSTDGSYVVCGSEKPRTEVTITRIEE